MILPGFTAEQALIRSTTAWFGTARAALATAAVRVANLPGGKYCGPCPPGSGPGKGGFYWCCWPTRDGVLCLPYSCDPCAVFTKACDRAFCVCDNDPNGIWISDPSKHCGGYCEF